MHITVDYTLLSIPFKDGGSLENVLQNFASESKGRKPLFVNAVFLVEGYEYSQMKERISAFTDSFSFIKYGRAILGTQDRIREFVKYLIEEYKINSLSEYLFVGHGTKYSENKPYTELERYFKYLGFSNVKIAVLRGDCINIDTFIARMKGENIMAKIKIYPLFINTGKHVEKDLVDFCQLLRNAGFDADYTGFCLSKNKKFQELYLQKAYIDK